MAMTEKEHMEETMQLLVFKLGDEEYAVDILQARGIEHLDQGITRVPRAPAFVEGVINLRGEVLPIVDLRKRFGLVVRPIGYDSRVIIVEVGGDLLGMIVDAIVEVLRVPSSSIEAAPEITKSIDTYYLAGVAKMGERLIVLLNLERTLSPQEAQELSQVKLG
ncbi:MAG: chemotaxis protein CheW [Bacteroidota bacterium]